VFAESLPAGRQAKHAAESLTAIRQAAYPAIQYAGILLSVGYNIDNDTIFVSFVKKKISPSKKRGEIRPSNPVITLY
jgi:hypothetical protein